MEQGTNLPYRIPINKCRKNVENRKSPLEHRYNCCRQESVMNAKICEQSLRRKRTAYPQNISPKIFTSYSGDFNHGHKSFNTTSSLLEVELNSFSFGEGLPLTNGACKGENVTAENPADTT